MSSGRCLTPRPVPRTWCRSRWPAGQDEERGRKETGREEAGVRTAFAASATQREAPESHSPMWNHVLPTKSGKAGFPAAVLFYFISWLYFTSKSERPFRLCWSWIWRLPCLGTPVCSPLRAPASTVCHPVQCHVSPQPAPTASLRPAAEGSRVFLSCLLGCHVVVTFHSFLP